jgi:hypothetical protein
VQALKPVQVTSHEQASLHLRRRLHEPEPEHVMSHAVLPQMISSAHASTPLHSTTQLDASPQRTLWSHE